jgi:DNA repair exonuclease SbcCD nuclease subunit
MVIRISIIGDCHCGFDYGGERGDDSFNALDEAVTRSLDADIIIQAGDLFDSRITRQEIFARVARILGKTKGVKSNAKLIGLDGKSEEDVSPSAVSGIPVVVIHGTHERRSKSLVNPVQELESAGLIVHLHGQTAVFEIEGRKVAIHGMSGVPERYAKDYLLKWAPKPVPGAINIFVFHQSLDPYVYSPTEPPTLKIEDLPSGFDLFVLGHIHAHDHKLLRGSQLLLTGSLTTTRVSGSESKQKKGFWTFDGATVSLNPLRSQRAVYCEDFEYTPNAPAAIANRLNVILSAPHGLKPIIQLRLRGTAPKGAPPFDLKSLQEKFGTKAILKVSGGFEAEEFADQADLLKSLRQSGLSAEEQGLKILQEGLAQAGSGLKADEIFDLLVEGSVDEIFKELTK